MKYLIVARPRNGASSATDVKALQAARDVMAAALERGVFDCVYQFASGRGGIAIVNAESHEKLWDWLTGYPLYSALEFELYPLADVFHAIDRDIERA